MHFFGIRLIGINAQNGRKLLLTIALIVVLIILRYLLAGLLHLVIGGDRMKRVRFWSRQAIQLTLAIIAVIGTMSIWFSDPGRMATALGFITAGLAIALQKAVTSVAGYFVILRGKTFTVGDRIVMGGVRGDVIELGFIQTTIMEMGQPPPVQNADPAMWVHSRQFTGRIVTVSNSRIFDEPVFNYTRDFPFIWEEMMIPVQFKDDRSKVEQILLQAARKHAVNWDEMPKESADHLHRKYALQLGESEPRVFMRITDNWMELTVRFLTKEHGIRYVKDAMSREVMAALDAAGIGIASGTYDVVGLPTVRVRLEGSPAAPPRDA